MKQLYVSHKVVAVTPMTRLQYNEYRDWVLPSDENGSDDGYLVEYMDGGKPNDTRHAGYISWTPKAQFDAGYTAIEQHAKVDFGHIKKLLDSLEFRFSVVPNTTTTACWAILNMQNGNTFQIGYGESACVNPANFDKALGERYAKERCIQDATNTIWKLEGYLLAVTHRTSDKF